MTKLVEKVEWKLPGSPKTEMYMYGEASVEANQEMQEPLEKLYQYENEKELKSDIYRKISNLSHVQKEINNCISNEILELVRGRGRTNKEIEESIKYILEEKLKV